MRHCQGSAVVEMAIMLPVLLIMFIGMVEFGMMISMKRQMGVVANQVSGVLYSLRTEDVMTDEVITAVMNEARKLGEPYQIEQITVRFCEWRNGSELWRNYKKTEKFETGVSSGSGGEGGSICNTDSFECGSGPATKESGHGAFVQVTTCETFKPLITAKLFSSFNVDLAVYNTSYIPMSETNQTQMLAGITEGGGHQAETGCSGTSCDEPPGPPVPVDQCKITSCPTGQQLVGSGAACSCQIKNYCIGSTLNEATNSCQVNSTTCPDSTYTYIANGNRCGYMPKCRIVSCGAQCATYQCDDCKAPSMLLASSGACIAFPTCPAGYSYDYRVSACTKPNAP